MDLIIGIGNRLRRDDGIGPTVVESLSDQPGVECYVVQQLTPDLAQGLCEAERVLFVDAAIDGNEPHLDRVAAEATRGLGHALPPAGLLDLADRLYGNAPPAWLLTVPGCDFRFGETLSPAAIARLPEARRHIGAWLEAGSAPVRT